MRRLEQDPEEHRELLMALSRQAEPTHEQPTIEFEPPLAERPRPYLSPINTGIVKRMLPEFGVPYGGVEHPEVDCTHWDDPGPPEDLVA
jgi:hypothetical protein